MALGMSEKRKKVENAYPGDNWRLRVQQMPDRQVAAIYSNLLARGKFDIPKKVRKSNNPLALIPADPYENYVQMTIFDYI